MPLCDDAAYFCANSPAFVASVGREERAIEIFRFPWPRIIAFRMKNNRKFVQQDPRLIPITHDMIKYPYIHPPNQSFGFGCYNC